MDFTWLGIQICICWSQRLFKTVGARIRKPFSIWCDHHLPHAERHIRLLIVACGMLSRSSSMAARSCWILAWTWTRFRTRQSRASQTWSIDGISGEYAGQGITGTFSASRNCVQILAIWGCALSCWNMRWWWRMKDMTMDSRTHHGISVYSNCHQ